jgi:hypothetical protein
VRFLIDCGANLHVVNLRGQRIFRMVFDDEMLEENQYAVLRELALADKAMARYITSYACENKRWDIPTVMMAEGTVNPADFSRVSADLLQCLDAVFRVASKGRDETIQRNCVNVLCHIIARPMSLKPVTHATRLLRDWNIAAGAIVKQAYEDCAPKVTGGRRRLRAFEVEISISDNNRDL